MLLRTSISNTKKFFHKTLKSFKSLLSSGYQRLPKTPPFKPFSPSPDMGFCQSYRELDMFYNDFTNRLDENKEEKKKRSKRKMIISSPVPTIDEREIYSGSLIKNGGEERKEGEGKGRIADEGKRKEILRSIASSQALRAKVGEEKGRIVDEGKRKEVFRSCSKLGGREERACLVAQKLKQMEMMDKSNMEHVLDIEEVLHYYSRLTCPAYVDIVDKFFADMYAEIAG